MIKFSTGIDDMPREPLRMCARAADLVRELRLSPHPEGGHFREVFRRRTAPRHAVPAGWWQAAEPLGEFAYAGATVGPGFDFADFAFMRADGAAAERLSALRPDLARLR